MPTEELDNKYHDLLVKLARYYVYMIALGSALTERAKAESTPGRKSGLFTHAKSIRRSANELRILIMEQRQQLIELFNSTNLIQISKQPLRLP